MGRSHDVVVVGGGHNGLVAATYLARAGKRVLVLERRDRAGGAATTHEVLPGFKFSTLSYVCSMLDPVVVEDLDLCAHGLTILPVDPAMFVPHPDGSHLMLWSDVARAKEEIRRLSEKDARRYGDLADLIGRLATAIQPLLRLTPPPVSRPSWGEIIDLLRLGYGVRRLGAADLHQLMRIAPMCVADLVAEWFDNPLLRAAVTSAGVWGVPMGPRSAGTAAALLYQLIGSGARPIRIACLPRGGMGSIAESLAGAARRAGVEIRTGAPVARIDVDRQGACGVTLTTGEEIRTRAVVSNADPKRTFLDLVGPAHLEPRFVSAIQNTRTQGCVAKVNLVLAELPDFRCLPGREPGPQHRARIQIGPDVDYLERAFDDSKYGRFSRDPYLDVLIPSVTDPSLAPAGRHVMSIFVQHAPYRLAEGDWDGRREELGDRVIDTLDAYAPNLKKAVLHRQVLTPLDLEREYGLTGGSIFHVDFALDQLFAMRPVPGWSRYRAPIPRLYMCGAGTHPGGGVTGVPGANAARELLHDFRTGVV